MNSHPHTLPHNGKLAIADNTASRRHNARMSYRTLYLVCYDICSPRRLRQVHHFLQGYKVGGQKSFFECWLTPPELRTVRSTLTGMIDPAEDRVHIFQLDPRMTTECYGQATTKAVGTPFMVL